MRRLTVSELLTATGGTLLAGGESTAVTSVSTDSRRAGEGALFIPLTGERFDGHDYIDKALALLAQMPGAWMPDQFRNPANARAHYETTGPEIWRDTEGSVDVLVAGVGSGGTVTGAGRYLKEQNPQIRVVAVEPAESPVLSGGTAGAHGSQGIGANFGPDVLDRSVVDEVLPVPTQAACAAMRALTGEGILAGISSGAAAHAARVLSQRSELAHKRIVAILPDTGERYLSTGLFQS